MMADALSSYCQHWLRLPVEISYLPVDIGFFEALFQTRHQ
jgi:hypothetical protein